MQINFCVSLHPDPQNWSLRWCCWSTLTIWCAKPLPLFIQMSYLWLHCLIRLLLSCFHSSSGLTVVIMYVILCAFSYIRVFYTFLFFNRSVQPVFWADWFVFYNVFWHFLGLVTHTNKLRLVRLNQIPSMTLISFLPACLCTTSVKPPWRAGIMAAGWTLTVDLTGLTLLVAICFQKEFCLQVTVEQFPWFRKSKNKWWLTGD